MSNLAQQGEYVVVGMVTGTHIIEDINTPVPYQVAVSISLDKGHRSRDLWIGIDQKRLFLLKGVSGAVRAPQRELPAPAAPAPIAPVQRDDSELKKTQAELKKIQIELAGSQTKLAGSQTKLTEALIELAETRKQMAAIQKGHTQKLDSIVSMLSRLETGQVSVVEGVQEALQAVGGDTPMFISENIKPKGAETSIQKKEVVLKSSSVKSAASTLRDLKKGKGKSRS